MATLLANTTHKKPKMSSLNATKKALPISQIEGMQTIVPTKVTYPRSSRCIFTKNSSDKYLLEQRCHLILYYKSLNSHDSGMAFAGHAKETLGKAMEGQPIIGGRVRRVEERENRGDDVAALEVVSNDCGIRLVEARIAIGLSEFLGLEGREEAESELVFWKDLDYENPQFGPLLYVQVTNFSCGGYSIGISCSLLLADPSALINFLISWAKIHTKIISEKYVRRLPLFYLPKLSAANMKNQISSDPIKNRNKSIIFMTQKKNQNKDIDTELMYFYIKEAENELDIKTAKSTCLFSVTSFEEITVKKYSRESVARKYYDKLARVDWDHFGANEISFYEGTKPISVSNWIYSASDEVVAILNPSSGEDNSQMSIIVSVPS